MSNREVSPNADSVRHDGLTLRSAVIAECACGWRSQEYETKREARDAYARHFLSVTDHPRSSPTASSETSNGP